VRGSHTGKDFSPRTVFDGRLSVRPRQPLRAQAILMLLSLAVHLHTLLAVSGALFRFEKTTLPGPACVNSRLPSRLTHTDMLSETWPIT
jgi:hypothetical protein